MWDRRQAPGIRPQFQTRAVASLAISIAAIFIAIYVAIAVPIRIERHRRPVLSIAPGEPLTIPIVPSGQVVLVHISVKNEPIKRSESTLLFRKIDTWLLRSVATGCRVTLTFEELGTGKRPVQDLIARWSGAPEPLAISRDAAGNTVATYDPTKTPQAERFDLSPDDDGETLAVAIKHDGDSSAYAFSSGSYQATSKWLTIPPFELSGDEYWVHVTASAGGIRVHRTFRLRNCGTNVREFRLAAE